MPPSYSSWDIICIVVGSVALVGVLAFLVLWAAGCHKVDATGNLYLDEEDDDISDSWGDK